MNNNQILTLIRSTAMKKDLKKAIQQRKEITSALIAGLKDADKYDKPYDKTIAIRCWLDVAGYKIVKKPKNARS